MGKLAKALAVAGTAVVWLPIAAMVATGAIGSIRSGRLRVDYLMPAELFPVALVGCGLLLLAALLARRRRALFVAGAVLMAGLLLAMQAVAVETGLATGEIGREGWPWALVTALLAGYTLTLLAVGVGGVLLARDLLRR